MPPASRLRHVLATLPFGLLLDLEWRSGLVRLAPKS
jgi:hypothetical protein